MILSDLKKMVQRREIVLGMNARNLDFVYPLNPRKYFRQVDDKIIAKDILSQHGIPVPDTLAIYRYHHDLISLEQTVADACDFVIKPSGGAGGRGILVTWRDPGGQFVTGGSKGVQPISLQTIRDHIIEILSGCYSLEHLADAAILEEKLKADERLGSLGSHGLPDIRLIVLRGRPIMAMLRVPTLASGNRSNLHQGGVGIGIDLETGETTHAIASGQSVTHHPDSGAPLLGLNIPDWRHVRETGVRAAKCVDLGFVGVDLALDRRLGAVVLELNARPGLSIQLANQMGLANFSERGTHAG